MTRSVACFQDNTGSFFQVKRRITRNAIIFIMVAHDTQSFFKPDEFFCQQEQLLSQTYNLAHVLLNRSQAEHLFVPIRTMQYLAIIERDIFWFVDSLAYAVRENEGGRLITVSWHPLTGEDGRSGLTQHMGCRVVYYGKDMSEVQNRLRGEFFQAMQSMDQRYRDEHIPSEGARILPLNAGATG